MRARQRLFCMAVLGTCLAGSGSAQQTVQWQPTLEVAKRVAGQTGRLVLIHFWENGCRPCQMMEQQVYSRADVAAAIDRDFVAVKVNRSHFPASASQYGVSSVPADVIITPQGQPIERHMGAVAASQYMSRLNRVASDWRKSAAAAGYARNSSPPPQGPAAPSFDARPGYEAAQVQGPPAMDGRYADGATTDYRNQQFAAGRPEPPVSGYSREATQPAESRYSPPLANNAAPSYRPESAQAPYSPQQPPYAGPRATTSPAPGDLAPANPESQLAQRRPPAYESNPQPAPVDEPAVEISGGNPPVALDGYCPVQLTEKKQWVLGNRRWGLRHEGRTYLFAGPDEQRRFNESPEEYAPVMSGNDVVLLVGGGKAAPGRRECGAWFMGRMFLFSCEATFLQFEANPEYYAAAIEESVSNVANRSAAPPASGRPWQTRN